MTTRDRLSRSDRWRIVRYSAAIAWGLAFALFTPTLYSDVLDVFNLTVICAGPILGGIAGIVGVATRRHLSIELPGLMFLTLCIINYLALQIPLLYLNGTTPGLVGRDRIALAVFALWMVINQAERLHTLAERLIDRLSGDTPEVRAARRTNRMVHAALTGPQRTRGRRRKDPRS